MIQKNSTRIVYPYLNIWAVSSYFCFLLKKKKKFRIIFLPKPKKITNEVKEYCRMGANINVSIGTVV